MKTEALKEVYMFRRLSDETLEQVAGLLETRNYTPGEVLFHKGEPGAEMFIVQDGSVAIFEPDQKEPGTERPLRIFRPGEAFGEMAIIDLEPRSLSARAVQATQVLVLKGDDFRRLLHDQDMAQAVMSGLNDRIRYTTDFLGEVRDWIGRMAAGQYETAQFFSDMQAWVQQLTEGDYGRDDEFQTQYRDQTIASLAADFARMAAQVKEREEELRQEIAQLKIEIDETKRKRQVDEIVESDFFQDIQARARELRRKRGD
ncbi:MAG: cyclic nucleotide-binding domain-containing protein [Anaerolineae bacterium]|jgi:CRP-like cAMP-binding protein